MSEKCHNKNKTNNNNNNNKHRNNIFFRDNPLTSRRTDGGENPVN